MIKSPHRRHACGARDPRGSQKLCRWTAAQLARADVRRLDAPLGRQVPQHLEDKLAHAHDVAVSSPGADAERAARDLLAGMSDWLGCEPVEVTITVGACSDDPDSPVTSELVVAQGID